MTADQLRASILQLAIQGKLVEQRPKEGSAKELLEQIKQEKQNLIAQGKIKKEKPLAPITNEEKPFEIPNSWEWVRLQELVILNPRNMLDDNLDVSFIPMALVSDGYKNTHCFEIRKWGKIKKGFTHFINGDIGIAKITPCFQNRKSVIFKNLKNGAGAGTTELTIVRIINELISRNFLLWFFKSEYFIQNGVKSFTGTAGQQRIHKDYLSQCLFPLPPLAEQKRIVEKLEQLLPHIDNYEHAYTKLEQLNKRFPLDIKKSLIQYAIQGKLVEQRVEEGNARELLEQIKQEKQNLIAQGKIKKEKPLLPITDEEKPFEIPNSWEWVRLGDIVSFCIGKTPSRNEKDWWQFDVPWVSIADMKTRGHITTTKENISLSALEKYFSNRVAPIGTLLMSFKLTIGKVSILDIEAVHNEAIVSIYPIINDENITKTYLFYVLPQIVIFGDSKSAIKGKTLNKISISNLIFPLPPLAEQKRIVEKLKQLLWLCESLE